MVIKASQTEANAERFSRERKALKTALAKKDRAELKQDCLKQLARIKEGAYDSGQYMEMCRLQQMINYL